MRVLVIGPDATALSARLRPVAPVADFEAARLPAAAVRAFEKSPPDIVVLCGSDVARQRLEAVLAALRARPLGGLVPCAWVGEGELEGVELCVDAGVEAIVIVKKLGELIGIEIDDLSRDSSPAQRVEAPLSEQLIEAKLRQVRHETYFDVLEVASDVSQPALHAAFSALCDRFSAKHVPEELALRFGEELAEVRDGIEDAFAVLVNDKLRAAYAKHRSGQRARE